MADSWKIRTEVIKPVARNALIAHEDAPEWPSDWVLVGMEIADSRPDDWFVEAFLPQKPSAADCDRFARLFANTSPVLTIEKLPDTDWVTESQKGVEPIQAGPFYIHTPDHPPASGAINLSIPASQAFGTGHHATTAGCLEMMAAMRRQGLVVRNCVDIGTGTGLLAFAALKLWPVALITASDIDPVCASVVEDNAALNHISLGSRRGELLMTIAPGMKDPLLAARAPYDLIIANILAAPLIDLASDFAASLRPGGSILLAGLLKAQQSTIMRAYRRAGFRLAQSKVRGDWSILWLRKRLFR